MDRIKVLLIEDNPGDARLVKEMLSEPGEVAFDLEWKDDLEKGSKRLALKGVDVLLLDLNLPDSKGFATFARMHEQAPTMPTVIVTGTDDINLAIRAVRKGAQDYLVKGQIDARHLARSIRYSIARRLGEERKFTLEELATYDGKDGRPTYVAAEGKVYDVSTSARFKNGVHAVRHQAGNDLTEELLSAPHGDEVLVRFHIVGEVARAQSLAQRAVRRIEDLHLHSISVHFSVAYSFAIPFLALLSLMSGSPGLELTSYYLLLLAAITTPAAGLTGLFSWRVTYQGRVSRVFMLKSIFTVPAVLITWACFAWRTLAPDILSAGDATAWIYLGLLFLLAPLVALLGHWGGRIVYH